MSGGRSLRWRCRKSIPSATHPGGKDVTRNLPIRTSLAKRSCKVLLMAASVKGQFSASRMAPNATPTTTTSAPSKIQRRSLGDAELGKVLCHFLIAETTDQMIFDYAGSLHEGVTDRGAGELEPALCQILAHGIRLLRARRQLIGPAQKIYQRLSTEKLPDVSIEASEFLLNGQKCLSVLHRRANLEPVAYDSFIGQQRRNLRLVVARHLTRIESIECGAVSRPLLEDSDPAQAGLRSFQDQQLKQCAVIVQRHAPLGVVVSDREFIARPGATLDLRRLSQPKRCLAQYSSGYAPAPGATSRHLAGHNRVRVRAGAVPPGSGQRAPRHDRPGLRTSPPVPAAIDSCAAEARSAASGRRWRPSSDVHGGRLPPEKPPRRSGWCFPRWPPD